MDDFSEFFVNACTTTVDKVPVAGIDSIANHAKFWAEQILQAKDDPDHTVTATLSNGEVLYGIVHP